MTFKIIEIAATTRYNSLQPYNLGGKSSFIIFAGLRRKESASVDFHPTLRSHVISNIENNKTSDSIKFKCFLFRYRTLKSEKSFLFITFS